MNTSTKPCGRWRRATIRTEIYRFDKKATYLWARLYVVDEAEARRVCEAFARDRPGEYRAYAINDEWPHPELAYALTSQT